ncbi:hypothetical protein CK203_080663 [Vitis vinifera]|uniref:Reverse transcriptase Ty1/copia-type domain-containing protein n=1 Tax=Vitis vinifera TaxID=29760 RepID=A0A438EZC5_VITVI|nr:hypothetical protein CK203_080663 [Vitis vinifera]
MIIALIVYADDIVLFHNRHSLSQITTVMDRKKMLIDRKRYQRSVGKFIYLSHTKLNIAYAVSAVSQFMHGRCIWKQYSEFFII